MKHGLRVWLKIKTAMISTKITMFTATEKMKHNMKGNADLFFSVKGVTQKYLFHKAREWMDNSTVMFWGSFGKKFNRNVLRHGLNKHRCCSTAMYRLILHSLCVSFQHLQMWLPFPPSYMHDFTLVRYFHYVCIVCYMTIYICALCIITGNIHRLKIFSP